MIWPVLAALGEPHTLCGPEYTCYRFTMPLRSLQNCTSLRASPSFAKQVADKLRSNTQLTCLTSWVWALNYRQHGRSSGIGWSTHE